MMNNEGNTNTLSGKAISLSLNTTAERTNYLAGDAQCHLKEKCQDCGMFHCGR